MCGTRSSIVEFCVIFSACRTRSGIVGFRVIFVHILKFLVEIIQLIFVHVCCIFHVVFFRVVLKSIHYLQQILLIDI